MNKKRIFALVLCALCMIGLVYYRKQEKVSIPTEPSRMAHPAHIQSLDAGVWPENRYTQGVPVPPGTVDWALLDSRNEFCAVQLQSVPQKQFDTYYQSLLDGGFEEIKQADDPEGTQRITVGTLLSDGKHFVSVAYSQQTMVLYLTDQGCRNGEGGFGKANSLANVYGNGYATYDAEQGVQVVMELYVPGTEPDKPVFHQVSGWVTLMLNGEKTVTCLEMGEDIREAVSLSVSTGVTGQSGDKGTVIIGGTACAENAAGGGGAFAVSFDITIP